MDFPQIIFSYQEGLGRVALCHLTFSSWELKF